VHKYKKSSLQFSLLRLINNKRLFSTLAHPKQLGPYLAGLIEGDGSIYTPSSEAKDTKNVPHIEICFSIKDLNCFLKIQNVLGGGYITIRPNGQSGRLTIKKKDVLLKLINLINGHMRTPKIEALHRAIRWINLKHNTSILLLGLDTTPLSESS
jgi:hypothetical protein